MSGLPIRGIASAIVGGGFAITDNMIALVIIGKINEIVPESERVSYLSWDSSIRRRYKKLYPERKLVLLFDLSVILMVIAFLACVRFWVFAD